MRAAGVVRYESDGFEEQIWFDLPVQYGGEVSRSGNPWLALLLPVAATLKEPLRIDAPVDPHLLEGCRSVLEVWGGWYAHLRPVAIEAPAEPPREAAPSGRTGLYFSGGVDSFYSLIKHTAQDQKVTDLLLVHGADIPIRDTDAFDRLRPRMAEVASDFGAVLIDIATNARATRWGSADWPGLAHGPLFFAAGLLLEQRLDRILIASSAQYRRVQPYGSHPITDALFSTSRTRILHDGAEVERPEKVDAIAHNASVLRHLRICWIGKNDVNCGRCAKCLNAMIGLELAGTLARCDTLPHAIDPRVFESLYLERSGTYAAYWMAMRFRQRALLAGRKDLVSLLDHSLRRSDRLGFIRDVIDALRRRGVLPAEASRRWIARLLKRSTKY